MFMLMYLYIHKVLLILYRTEQTAHTFALLATKLQSKCLYGTQQTAFKYNTSRSYSRQLSYLHVNQTSINTS